MRVIITNFGTTGDFRPLLTLARELAAQGDTPVLAFPPFAEPLVSQSGFEFCAIGPDLRSLRDQVNQGWSESAGIYNSSEQMLALLLPFREAFDQIFSELKDACRRADALISGPAQPMARMVHEVSGIPFVSIQVSHFGGSGGPGLRQAGEQLINPFRQKLGLPPVSDPLTNGANSPQLALYAMSSHLRPRPADWPAHYRVTGFFFDAPGHAWKPDAMLENFFAEGEPPVVITLGSMVHSESKKLVAALCEAIEMAECRAVLQGMPVESRPERATGRLHWADFVPHDWLFPRAACIVLHGGAGTAAATFRSGIPGIFVPHGDCYDQRYWGQLAEEAGCSVPAIQYSDLEAPKLAAAITASINNAGLRRAAAALGAKIRKEPGARYAARLIKEFVARVGLYEEVG
jgi:sterol 3beta-glucosyltransferase